jgi:hypothetical protein
MATAAIGATTSAPLVPVKRTVGAVVVVERALAAVAKTTAHAFIAGIYRRQQLRSCMAAALL